LLKSLQEHSKWWSLLILSFSHWQQFLKRSFYMLWKIIFHQSAFQTVLHKINYIKKNSFACCLFSHLVHCSYILLRSSVLLSVLSIYTSADMNMWTNLNCIHSHTEEKSNSRTLQNMTDRPREVCTRSVTKVEVAGHTQLRANMAYLNSSSHTTWSENEQDVIVTVCNRSGMT